jgi:hypothetical protein
MVKYSKLSITHQIWESTYKIFMDWTTIELAVTDCKIQVIWVITVCNGVIGPNNLKIIELSSSWWSSFLSGCLTLKMKALTDVIRI